MRGTQGQVLKAEPHHFKIHNQILGVFHYYSLKVQVSKVVSFFSLVFASWFKKNSINAAVDIIAVCATACWIYMPNYPNSIQPSKTCTCKKSVGCKIAGRDAPFPYAVTLNMHIH